MSQQPTLRAVSTSFADLVDRYSDAIQDKATELILQRPLAALSRGAHLPSELEGQYDELAKHLFFLAKCFLPKPLHRVVRSSERKTDAWIDKMVALTIGSKAFRSIPGLGASASKLLRVAAAMGIDPMTSDARLVDGQVAFKDARDRFDWAGTLLWLDMVEGGTCVIWFPTQKISFGQNGNFKVKSRIVRNVPRAQNVRLGPQPVSESPRRSP